MNVCKGHMMLRSIRPFAPKSCVFSSSKQHQQQFHGFLARSSCLEEVDLFHCQRLGGLGGLAGLGGLGGLGGIGGLGGLGRPKAWVDGACGGGFGTVSFEPFQAYFNIQNAFFSTK